MQILHRPFVYCSNGSPILETSVRFWSWSCCSAVSPQVIETINPVVGCHYFPPGPRLPPQSLSLGWHPILLGSPVYWSVANYTAWWQRHMCLNNLPRVALAARQSGIRPETCWWQVQPPGDHSATEPHCMVSISIKIVIMLRFVAGVEGKERGREKSWIGTEFTVQNVSAIYEKGWTRPDVIWTRVTNCSVRLCQMIPCLRFSCNCAHNTSCYSCALL